MYVIKILVLKCFQQPCLKGLKCFQISTETIVISSKNRERNRLVEEVSICAANEIK